VDAADIGQLITAALTALAAVVNVAHALYRRRLTEADVRYLQLVTRQAELFNERFADTQRLLVTLARRRR